MISGADVLSAALKAGFCAAGLCEPKLDDEDREAWHHYLDQKHQGDMDFLSRSRDERAHGASALLVSARSVLVVAASYFDPSSEKQGQTVARYAQRKDYHKVLKRKLVVLCNSLRQENENFDFKISVDTSPILERAYARKAGLGFIGKNRI